MGVELALLRIIPKHGTKSRRFKEGRSSERRRAASRMRYDMVLGTVAASQFLAMNRLCPFPVCKWPSSRFVETRGRAAPEHNCLVPDSTSIVLVVLQQRIYTLLGLVVKGVAA